MSPPSLTQKKKTVLLSLILPPCYDAVVSGKDRVATHDKKKSKTSNRGLHLSQDQMIDLKYHGIARSNVTLQLPSKKMIKYSSLAAKHGNDGSGLSMLDMFMQMQGPYECFIQDRYASVVPQMITDRSHATAGTAANHDEIRFDLALVMGLDERILLGINNQTSVIHRQLTFNNLKAESWYPAKGKSLIAFMKNLVAKVKLLIAYEKKFYRVVKNADNPSGTTDEDLREYVRGQAHKYLSDKNDADDDADGEDDDSSEENVDEMKDDDDHNSQPKEKQTSSSEAGNQNWPIAPVGFYPAGWSAWVAYVCDKTRVTDRYLHIFDGSGESLDKSSAKSRKQAREEDSATSKSIRDFDDKRGISSDLHHAMVSTASKRSSDIAFRKATLTTTLTTQIDQLVNQKRDCEKSLSNAIKNNLSGLVQAYNDELLDIMAQLKDARKLQASAIKDQIQFEQKDQLGQMADKYLFNQLASPISSNHHGKRLRDTDSVSSLPSTLTINNSARRAGRNAPLSPMSNVTDNTHSQRTGKPFSKEELELPSDEAEEKGVRSLHDLMSKFLREELKIIFNRPGIELPTVDDMKNAFQKTNSVLFKSLLIDLQSTPKDNLWPGFTNVPHTKEGLGWIAAHSLKDS